MLPDANSESVLLGMLEKQFDVAKAILVARAALGLEAVLRCWRGERALCRVALPAAVCQEVVVAVLAAGCDPVFCDVNVSDGLVKDSEWPRARALGADVALVVHLYGNAASTRNVRDAFPAPACLIIDDAAQALGSRGVDGLAGAQGDVGLLSFGHSKHITCGNAVVLFHDAAFALKVSGMLAVLESAPEEIRDGLAVAFRTGMDRGRARLREVGDAAAFEFSGLLKGIEPVLRVPLEREAVRPLVQALQTYPEEIDARVRKAGSWARGLANTGVLPVGMGPGSVPWRYTCRLPGIDWRTQHELAEAMRSDGVHVSTWYLPAHWYLGGAAGTLPGVETLAREVFQFWVDPGTTRESIEAHAIQVRRRFEQRPALATQDL